MTLFFQCAAALVCFAGNSLLCRAALGGFSGTGTGRIDAASFTVVRMVSGAFVLAVLLRLRGPRPDVAKRDWLSPVALVGYAAFFSFSYRLIDTGVGAFLLFGAVQVTMLGASVFRREGVRWNEWVGLLAAGFGLLWLTLPGKAMPPWEGAAAMVVAGVAWGVYSLRGRAGGDPLARTARSFAVGAAASLVFLVFASVPSPGGVLLAALSGAVTSGIGYTLWYAALPRLSRHRAAILQLVAPVLAAAGGVVLLGETVPARLLVAALFVVAGVLSSLVPAPCKRSGSPL